MKVGDISAVLAIKRQCRNGPQRGQDRRGLGCEMRKGWVEIRVKAEDRNWSEPGCENQRKVAARDVVSRLQGCVTARVGES
eukprot:3199759-Rhodomonas_salina.2